MLFLKVVFDESLVLEVKIQITALNLGGFCLEKNSQLKMFKNHPVRLGSFYRIWARCHILKSEISCVSRLKAPSNCVFCVTFLSASIIPSGI